MLGEAQEVLKGPSLRDVVNIAMLPYVQKGQDYEALNCFEEMQNEGLTPNAVTFMPILKSCRKATT